MTTLYLNYSLLRQLVEEAGFYVLSSPSLRFEMEVISCCAVHGIKAFAVDWLQQSSREMKSHKIRIIIPLWSIRCRLMLHHLLTVLIRREERSCSCECLWWTALIWSGHFIISAFVCWSDDLSLCCNPVKIFPCICIWFHYCACTHLSETIMLLWALLNRIRRRLLSPTRTRNRKIVATSSAHQYLASLQSLLR